ncbi:MAG: hypothetical protein MJ225_04200 [Bacilli bacterium]|nr:hypothetical protein [Bacilli bacterium]
MKKIKRIVCLFTLAFALLTPFMRGTTNSEANVSYAVETQNEGSLPKPITQERINAILNSGKFFNMNYIITYNFLTWNEDTYRIIQHFGTYYLDVMHGTQDNQPVGQKNPAFIDPFINIVLDEVFTNNKRIEKILAMSAEAVDNDNILLMAALYINIYIPTFINDMINAVLGAEESPYTEDDLMVFDYLKLYDDYDSGEDVVSDPTMQQIKFMIESGGYYNIHYRLIELYLNRDTSSLRRYAFDSHNDFKYVVSEGLANRKAGTKLPQYNVKAIGDLINSAIVANPRIIMNLCFYASSLSFSFGQVLVQIYQERYLPSFLAGVQAAIDRLKEDEDCPELLKDFENYDVEFENIAVEEKTIAKVPYYWIIVVGIAGIAATAITFIILDKKKRKVTQA